MKSKLLYFIRLYYNATSIQRIQRLIVMAVKQDAGTAASTDIMELHIIQAIRTHLCKIPRLEPIVDNDLIWPEKHN